ncbi:hypothetical protein ACFW7J_13840 [Streptomyces sp. NPDC059525]
MSDEQTRKVVEQFNQAFRLHDPGLLKDILAEDCRLEGGLLSESFGYVKG